MILCLKMIKNVASGGKVVKPPLNEVRVLCNSILLNQGMLQVDKLPRWPNSAGSGIKLPREKSVLKLSTGDDVKLSEADFVRLSKAFFAEIEKRYL